MFLKKLLNIFFLNLKDKEFPFCKLLSTKFLENFFYILKISFFTFVNIILLIIISKNFYDATKTFFLAYKLRSQLLIDHGLTVADIFSKDILFLQLDEFVIFN